MRGQKNIDKDERSTDTLLFLLLFTLRLPFLKFIYVIF